MILQYILDENDYLQHQLYTASKSERIKSQRIKSWIIVSAAFLILGFVILNEGNSFLGYYFLGFGLISLIFYPIYLKNHYKNHYQKFIKDTYKNRFGEILKVVFNENSIDTSGFNSESKINYTALEEINEIEQYFFLKLKSGGSLIIPKFKIEEIDNMKEKIKEISEKYDVVKVVELNWKWK